MMMSKIVWILVFPLYCYIMGGLDLDYRMFLYFVPFTLLLFCLFIDSLSIVDSNNKKVLKLHYKKEDPSCFHTEKMTTFQILLLTFMLSYHSILCVLIHNYESKHWVLLYPLLLYVLFIMTYIFITIFGKY